jgi:hypothetical protein
MTSTFAPDEHTTAAWSREADEVLQLCATSRANILVIGPDPETEDAIALITGQSASALPTWPAADMRPPSFDELAPHAESETVVVRGVQALDAAAQQRLHDWLAERAGRIRVIATATALLYPMVERQEFLEPLYYRLNVMCVGSADMLSRSGSRESAREQ